MYIYINYKYDEFQILKFNYTMPKIWIMKFIYVYIYNII